jgi:hypothetical protein
MQINLLWTGKDYYSLEDCLLVRTDTGSEITSVIVGMYEQHLYRVEYVIQTNLLWETIRCDINAQVDNTQKSLRFHSDGQGNWTLNNQSTDRFRGCTDIDISLTPFTNTLPVNRLKLAKNESSQLQVLSIDLLTDEVKPVRQTYTRLSETTYKYENVPNDFEAVLTVDEFGLVVDYPPLFERTAINRYL